MSYAQTTIIIYGIKINHEQAKDLCQRFDRDNQLTGEESLAVEEFYLCAITTHDDKLWDIPSKEFEEKHGGRNIFYVSLYSDNTDSRIHSTHLEEDYETINEYYFGIYCGSKGYAYNDNISSIAIHGISDKAKDNWDKYCKKYFDIEPQVLICSQVW